MTPALRVGAVGYLNARPLIHRLDRGAAAGRIRLSLDTPAGLADRMAAGELDLALLPVIELARIPDLEVAPGLGIVSPGPARSVRLVSRVPLASVRRVALDPDSRAANALAQVLFAEVWGGRPEFVVGPPELGRALEGHDAVVRIGDKALFETLPEGVEVEDLGRAWADRTGLPFVFAVWACRPGVLDRELYELLHRCRREGCRALDRIAAEYTWNGTAYPELAREYLRSHIRYRLGAAELRAIEVFLGACARLGLIGEAPRIRVGLDRWTACDETASRMREPAPGRG
jgi:chorismate dehydratase